MRRAPGGRAVVKVNCAALPRTSSNPSCSHVRAFTGHDRQVGLLEEANRGSLLLDEITEMPSTSSQALARAGGPDVPADRRREVDLERLSADLVDQPQLVLAAKEGHLRRDLYFRINTVTITIPPLRERAEDIRCWSGTSSSATVQARRPVEGIAPDAYRQLLSTAGPATCGSSSTPSSTPSSSRAAERLPSRTCPRRPRAARLSWPRACRQAPRGDRARVDPAGLGVDGLEKQAAAALLGLRRPTLYSKMRKHDIPSAGPDGVGPWTARHQPDGPTPLRDL